MGINNHYNEFVNPTNVATNSITLDNGTTFGYTCWLLGNAYVGNKIAFLDIQVTAGQSHGSADSTVQGFIPNDFLPNHDLIQQFGYGTSGKNFIVVRGRNHTSTGNNGKIQLYRPVAGMGYSISIAYLLNT